MTTREHFNQIMAVLEEDLFSETYCSILESEDIEEIRPLIETLYNELMKEVDALRGDQDFYEGNKDLTINEYTQMKNEAISTNVIEGAKALATAIYDALVIEKIRTYAYKVYLEGGINHYVQFASDMQDCYLDSLKEDGLYDEWRGSECADVDCMIGDGLKLGEN